MTFGTLSWLSWHLEHTLVALRWFGYSRGSGATHENHTLMSQRVHLLPNGLEVEGISCEIWCQDNMFVPLNTSCSHSFKQSSRPATYSSWLTNQSLGIPSVRWHMWRWRICIFAKKTKQNTELWGKFNQTVTFSGLNPCESGRRNCLVTWESWTSAVCQVSA